MKAVLALLCISTAVLLFAACGGGGGDDDEAPTATVEEAEPTEAPDAGETTTQIDESFWHAGWKVTLGEARLAEGDFGTRTVSIDAVFENLSSSTSTFNSQLALTSGGESYASSALEQELPEVPGGLSGNGVIAVEVDETFSFDDATLIIGNPENNQAVVPLGPGGDDLVSLEPREIAVTGTATAGAVTVAVERAELRADLPDWSDEVEAGSLALTIYFSATPSSGIQIGQGVLQSENVALKLPDGTAVAVRSDGRSGVNELLQGREGTTIRDLQVRFIVPAPAEGDYAFVLRGNYGPGGTMVEGELPFTIP
jgi:hypothetical protein